MVLLFVYTTIEKPINASRATKLVWIVQFSVEIIPDVTYSGGGDRAWKEWKVLISDLTCI